MKPLILIGASGLVGRRIMRAFPRIGHQVVPVGRAPDMLLRWDMDGPPPPCPAARGAGVVILAGVTPVSSRDLALNTTLAATGIAAARVWGAAHCFVMSSSAVYGGTSREGADEDTTPTGTSAYAHAKLQMEKATRARDVTALRLANVAGASEPFLAIRRGQNRLDRFPGAEDAPSRSFIGPEALARALAALCGLAERGVTLPSVLNLAARYPVAMAEIFAAAGLRPDRPEAPAGAVPFAHLRTARLDSLWPVPHQDATALWDDARATDPP